MLYFLIVSTAFSLPQDTFQNNTGITFEPIGQQQPVPLACKTTEDCVSGLTCINISNGTGLCLDPPKVNANERTIFQLFTMRIFGIWRKI